MTKEVTHFRVYNTSDELLTVIKTDEMKIALVYRTLKSKIKILEVRITDAIIAGAKCYLDIKRIALSKK
jgi:hypothetical protein